MRIAAMLLTCLACIPCPAADGDVVFEDSFAGPSLSPQWARTSAAWRVRDGHLVNTEPVAAAVLAGTPTWEDYALEVRMKTDEPGPRPWSVARILFRRQDADNFYYVVLHRDGLLELGKGHGGRHMPGLSRAPGAGDPLDWRRVRISLDGPRIVVGVDGREVIDFTDPAPILSGQIGLDAFQGSVVRFDDVRVVSAGLAERIRREEQAMTAILDTIGYRKSAVGNTAVFRDDAVPVENGAPSDPEHIARLVRQIGCEVTFLTASQMSAPGVLSTANFDVIILPYGAAFPRGAVEPFRRFLQEHGSFISMGGYFADNLYGPPDPDEADRLVSNGGFEQGLAHWQASHDTPGLSVAAIAEPRRSGRGAVAVTVTEDARVEFYSVLQRVDTVIPGQGLLAEAWVKTEEATGGAGAYIALNYFRQDGDRIAWSQSTQVSGTRDWTRVQVRGTVPAETAYLTVNLLLHGHGRAWFDDVDVRDARGAVMCLNTREGDIRGPGNSLRVSPDQIGVFDPSYRLEQVTSLRTSPGQAVTSAALDLPADAAGYSASGMFIGNGNPIRAVTHARPVYLVDAFDRFGRLRGRAGALIRNYLGAYTGSDWAVFGVNNSDLFAPDNQQAAQLLGDTVRALLDKTYLAEVHPEFACYRDGEPVTLEALVANFMRDERTAEVRFMVTPGREPGPAEYESRQTVTLPPGCVTKVEAQWEPQRFSADFYTVTAELVVDGNMTDRHENAFVVWRESELAKGPRMSTKDAYVALDGSPAFLCGTGDAGYPYYAESETPLVWDDQFRLMRDMGLGYYRVMHFFGDYPSDTPLETLDDLPKAQLRRLDALVYLAHKHGLGFLFVNNVGLQLARDAPADLAGRKRALRLLARRYANAPGFMFNMDHQEFIRAGAPGADEAFRAFLGRKYARYADLADAWGLPEGGSLDDIRFDESAAREEPWGSARGLDTGEFLCSYRDAWRYDAATSVGEGNAEVVYCQDFSMYWWPDFAWPTPDVTAHLDMSATHFYGDQSRFPMQLKRADMQVLGLPLAQTEFGILTHPAWTDHRDCRLTHDGADEFFMLATHYSLGVGATMLSNWNWKENKECIFPWAIAHHDLVPKEHLRAYRNAALLLGSFSPRYEPPEVFVVVPNAHLRTNRAHVVDAAVRDCIARLMSRRVRFSLIGEEYLDRLPDTAGALFYPVPFCPDDEVVANLVAFVENGGCLYFSGDISFDPSCRRVRAERLEKLAGCRYVSRNYPHLEAGPDAGGRPCIRLEVVTGRVLADSEDGPSLVYHVLGRGRVLYAVDPIEARSGDIPLTGPLPADIEPHEPPGDPYDLLLALSGVQRIPVTPVDPSIHSFQLATQEGGTVYVLFNTGDDRTTAALTHAERRLQLTIAPRRPALAHFDRHGALVAVASQEQASLDGRLLWFGAGHFILLSLDGANLGDAPSLVAVMAVGTGHASIPCASSIERPVVQHGELRDLQWRPLHAEATGDGPVTVTAAASTRSTITLIAEGGRQDEAARLIEQIVRR